MKKAVKIFVGIDVSKGWLDVAVHEQAGLIAQPDLPLKDMLDRYELYTYKQWMRVYMRSKMIKHNKNLFESIDNRDALLDQLHIY